MAKRQTKTETTDLLIDNEVVETPKVEVKKEVVKEQPKSNKEIGNLVKFQEDKDRIIKIGYRDAKDRTQIAFKEIAVSDYHLPIIKDDEGKEINNRLKYVGVTYDHIIVKNRTSLDELRSQETQVKDFPLVEFLRQGINQFCYNLGFDEWTIEPDELTASHIYVLIRDIDEKFIEQRFEHLLEKETGGVLVGAAKRNRVKQILENFRSIRVGNTLILAENILHIPNFNDKIKLTDM